LLDHQHSYLKNLKKLNLFFKLFVRFQWGCPYNSLHHNSPHNISPHNNSPHNNSLQQQLTTVTIRYSNISILWQFATVTIRYSNSSLFVL
jgi:hypothetical protein